MPHTDLMAIRPTSQMLTLYVIPEIAARLAAGTLAKGDIPVQVSQFRVVMRHGKFRVEINEEAQVVIEVPSRRAIASGDEITRLRTSTQRTLGSSDQLSMAMKRRTTCSSPTFSKWRRTSISCPTHLDRRSTCRVTRFPYLRSLR